MGVSPVNVKANCLVSTSTRSGPKRATSKSPRRVGSWSQAPSASMVCANAESVACQVSVSSIDAASRPPVVVCLL